MRWDFWRVPTPAVEPQLVTTEQLESEQAFDDERFGTLAADIQQLRADLEQTKTALARAYAQLGDQLNRRAAETAQSVVEGLMAPIFEQLATQQRAWQGLDMQVTGLRDAVAACEKAALKNVVESDHAYAHAEEAKRQADAAARKAEQALTQPKGTGGGGIGSIA